MHRHFVAALACATTSLAMAQTSPASLCVAPERTYFSCDTRNGKTISVCGSPDKEDRPFLLQYRYGMAGGPMDLVHPPAPRSASGLFDFGLGGMGAKSAVGNLRFRSGAFTYVVFSLTNVYEDAAGVEVRREGRKPVRVLCKPNKWDARGDREVHIEADSFPDLIFVGLPEIQREDLTY